MMYAHRASWELHNGAIPEGLMVLHRCDVRDCVNPEHLFLGTCDDNLKDCSRKGRMHPGEQNGMAKLSTEQVEEIKRLLATGVARKLIAVQFEVHSGHIGKIARGQKWRHVA